MSASENQVVVIKQVVEEDGSIEGEGSDEE